MAKGQLRSNRETKKPKQPKKPAIPAGSILGAAVRGAATPPSKKR